MHLLRNLLAVAVALYPSLVASSMHKVRHSPDLAIRDDGDAVMPMIINVTLHNNPAAKRDVEPPFGYYYSWAGCIDEIYNYPVRVLNHQIVDWDKVGVDTCAQACFDAGPIDGPFGAHYLFVGVKNGNECWCDNAMNVQIQLVSQYNCNVLCEAGPHEICGGSREYQMYFLGQTGVSPYTIIPINEPYVGLGSGRYDYRGCFPDDTSARALEWHYAADNMTPGRCAAICWQQNFTWAGVEYGRECWCGNQNNALEGNVASWNCNQACAGDSTLSCGAPGYIELYQTSYPNRQSL